jgi:hypothetical protein
LERIEIVNEILNNPAYLDTCRKLDASYSDDIYQEVIEQILTIPAERLPTLNYLQFWYYCVAKNIISRNGKLGKLFSKEIPMDEFMESESERIIDDSDLDFKKIENFMLGCSQLALLALSKLEMSGSRSNQNDWYRLKKTQLGFGDIDGHSTSSIQPPLPAQA